MPEWSEIKIMAEYVNTVVKDKKFVNIRKSEVSKSKTDLKGNWRIGFCLKAQSRGKELRLDLNWIPNCFKEHLGSDKTLMCNMGMSGYWSFVESDKIPKHGHLIFDTDDGYSLVLVDARRFARWQWVEDWSKDRGPDPVNEHVQFQENILKNLDKKEFQKPVYEVLMNQKYFNGLGAYLVAEILGRWDKNPFQVAKEGVDTELLSLCRQIPSEAYFLNGGQLSDWVNPFGEEKDGFESWMLFYQNKRECFKVLTQKNKRGIWLNKKWRQLLIN